MANSMFKKKIRLPLSIAQHRFFQEQIGKAKLLGDCRSQGLTLIFDDYEGAHATLVSFQRVRFVTTREYVSWNSVVDRLNAAIVDAVKA